MTRRTVSIGLLLLGVMAIAVFGAAQDDPTEAPAGFDTPTLVQNSGTQSQSNGIVEPAGDTYTLDQQVYETAHDLTTGLGPVFNARATGLCRRHSRTPPTNCALLRYGGCACGRASCTT